MVGYLWLCWLPKRRNFWRRSFKKEEKIFSANTQREIWKQETQKLTSLENPLENLIIMFSILEPESKKPPPSPPCAKNHDQNWKPPLIPYYQKVLPQTPKYQTSPTSQTQTQKLLPCYMFDHASTSYSQNFPPLESFDHPQTNTKHVWKIKNPVGTKRQVSSAKAALN